MLLLLKPRIYFILKIKYCTTSIHLLTPAEKNTKFEAILSTFATAKEKLLPMDARAKQKAIFRAKLNAQKREKQRIDSPLVRYCIFG